MHRTSPPWPIERAWRSVMTPFGVETITVPMPPEHLRQLVLAAVDPQARTADALEAVDDRTAFVILQLDGQGRLFALVAARRKSAM